MSVVFSPQARADLIEIRKYIARENVAAAKREVAKIRESIKLLAAGGVEGREVVLKSGEQVRLWLVSSYRLYYRRKGKELQILRVYHQARKPIER